MILLLNFLILVVGFVALIKGADWFVDGSAALAKNFKVPGVIIGLTVVAMGTSAPELAVSSVAALSGSNEIALSNVVGSNLFNLLMVLGICAIIHKVPVDEIIVKRDFPFSIIITALILLLTCGGSIFKMKIPELGMYDVAGNVKRYIGIILLVIFVCYIVFLIIDAKKHPIEEEEVKAMPVWKCFLLILIGVALIVGGGEAVVYSAKNIARFFGMSETLIGLTIIAFGTSLPELVTSIVAARKGETGLAVGNVVGSNIFNLLLILGVSSTIHPIAVISASMYDMTILIIVSTIVYLFCIKDRSISRREGIIMVLLYLADMAFAAIR